MANERQMHDQQEVVESLRKRTHSGNSSIVKKATVVITDAEFKAAGQAAGPDLNGGIEIVPAQGLSKIICPLRGLISVDVRGNSYSFSPVVFSLRVGETSVIDPFSEDLISLLEDGGYPAARFLLELGTSILSWNANFFEDAVNNPLIFNLRNSVDANDPVAISDGNAANRIAIQVIYTIFDAVLGDDA